MKPVTARALAGILEARGWKRLRVAGSHHIYGKEGETARLSIPFHGNKPLKTGLARHLLRLAKIDPADL